MNNIKELEDLKTHIVTLEDKIKSLQGSLDYEQEINTELQIMWANESSKADRLKKAIENILEYIKCEIDEIEVIDKIEHILMEANYYEQH